MLLGRNGAGKSTTLKTLMGLVRPAGGRIRFAGQQIAGREPYRIARAGLGYVPEERRIFADLTVHGKPRSRPPAIRARARRPGPRSACSRCSPTSPPCATRQGGRMSGGEQQMLTIARTLMGNPRLILLDEPSEGLAPVIVQQMARAVLALKAEGVAILLAEQNLRFAAEVGDRAVVLQSGRVAWSGTMAALLADEPARRAHLAV